MKEVWFFFSVWLLQGIAMLMDEFIFHHKRGLGKWESLGHPIDTFFFLLPFIYCLSFPVNSEMTFLYLSVISCLVITKDEWIHQQQASARETWLHAIQFILHPISLYTLFHFWQEGLTNLIKFQTIIIIFFMMYQIIYWNFLRRNKYAIKN